MPYIIRKNRNQNTYRVMNAITKDIHAKATTKEKAEAQVRLMNMINVKESMMNYKKHQQ